VRDGPASPHAPPRIGWLLVRDLAERGLVVLLGFRGFLLLFLGLLPGGGAFPPSPGIGRCGQHGDRGQCDDEGSHWHPPKRLLRPSTRVLRRLVVKNGPAAPMRARLRKVYASSRASRSRSPSRRRLSERCWCPGRRRRRCRS